MSGDIQIETKKIEAEAKPILLTASASMDIYLPTEVVKKEAPATSGVSGFVQEMYALPKVESTEAKKTEPLSPEEKRFREQLEKGSLKDLQSMAKDHSKTLNDLHRTIDSVHCASPEKRAAVLKSTTERLAALTPEMSALRYTSESKKTAATDSIQKGIDSGKIDLSNTPAKLKFETPEGSFNVKSSERKLTISTSEGKVTYSLKDGQIVERKDGVERSIGSADTRESYVFTGGTLQKLDPNAEPNKDGIGTTRPVFDLGGDSKSLKTNITTSGSNVAIDRAGMGPKIMDLQDRNTKDRADLERKIQEFDKPCPTDGQGCHREQKDSKDNKDNTNGRNWTADMTRPGGGSGHPGSESGSAGSSYGGNPASRSIGGSSEQVSSTRSQPDQVTTRQVVPNITMPSISVRPESEVRSQLDVRPMPFATRAQAQEVALPRSIDQRALLPQAFSFANDRSLTVPMSQARQMAPDAIAASRVSQNYYDMKPAMQVSPLSRMEQITPGRVAEFSRLQAPLSQASQHNYQSLLNNPSNSLTKQLSVPNLQQQPFNSLARPNVLGGNPLVNVFRVAPGNLNKTANGSLNSFGKSLQEVKDPTVKAVGKNFGGSSINHFTGQSTGRRLADLISDKAPGAHSSVTDKWTPVKAVSGGSAAGGDVGPFIPISGRIGGAGSGVGARGEGTKGFGTKPDGRKAIEGTRVQGGSNFADGGKRVEGVKNVEGVKSNGGSSIADGGKRVEGVKNFDGTKSNGGSSIADGGKRVEGVKNVDGTKSNGGSSIADGGKRVEGVKNVEGVKSNGGSSIADGGKGVDGIKNVEGTKSNGGSSIVDGGRRVGGNTNGASAGVIGDSSVTPAAVIVGQSVGVGGSVKDGKVTRDDKEGQQTQGESQASGQKDPGFGYTPRRSPYTVKQGETLESIARQRWGDERLAELIRTINLHRLNVAMESGKAVLKLSAGDILWLPSPIEAERFKKVCDIKGDGQRTLTVGYSV